MKALALANMLLTLAAEFTDSQGRSVATVKATKNEVVVYVPDRYMP